MVTRAWQMFFGQAWSLGGQGYWADCLAIAEVVLAAAEATGDQVALGWTHATVGRYGTFTGAHDEDRAHLARGLDHFRRAGDLSGQAWAHLFTSGAYTMRGDLAEAVVQSGQALALFRQTGDQAGQGWPWLAWDMPRLPGGLELARGYAGQALEVTPKTGDATTLAMAWHARAFVHSQLGEQRQAISCYRQALALAGERKHPMARGVLVIMLAEFGDICRAAGDLPAAVEAWRRPCRSSATWDGRTCWEWAPGSSRPTAQPGWLMSGPEAALSGERLWPWRLFDRRTWSAWGCELVICRDSIVRRPPAH